MKVTEAGMCTAYLKKGKLTGGAWTLLPLFYAPRRLGIYVCHSPYSTAQASS